MAGNVLPRSVQRLINEFARLPGIGPKSASRLVFFLLRSADANQPFDLANALVALKESTRYCSVCHNITEEDPCEICADQSRDLELLCVVEEPLDVVAIERSRAFNGRYHVLHGAISPVEGIGPEDLRIPQLFKRLEQERFREIIIATNATLEGDTTTRYIERHVRPLGVKLSSLARGLAVGSDLEYTDEITLSRALQGRQDL